MYHNICSYPIFLLLLTINLQGQTNQIVSDSIGNQYYTLTIPKRWEVDKSGSLGPSFIALSAIENDEDKFRENVNLITQDLSGTQVDLQYYAEYSEAQVKDYITDAQIIESKYVNHGSKEAYFIRYTGTQGIYKLKFTQYMWVLGEVAYILTFTSEQAKTDAFEPIGKAILDSFTF